MGNPLISISVPVYNAEKYLRQCLDSLVNQTLKDIEIVIVNDGSTDSSEAICREYAEKDSRIVLICKENGGSASARQAALKAAHGQFFCACDADDWAEPTMYEKLYQKAVETGADIVMCDYWNEYPGRMRTEQKYTYDLSERTDLLDDLLNGAFPKAVWSKLIRREFLAKHQLTWAQGINQGEDFLMTAKMILAGATVANTGETLYHYRRDNNGASYTHNITLESYNQSLAIIRWVESHVDKERYAKGLHHTWISVAYTGLRVKCGMTADYYKATVLKQCPLHDFVRHRNTSIKAIIVMATKLLGYRFGQQIVKLVKIFNG